MTSAPPNLPKPDAILFDWDNTLVDTWPVIHAALAECFTAMGHPVWSMETVKTEVKQSLRDAFPQLFGDRWQEAGDHYQRAYRSRNLRDLAALPDAELLLIALAKTGIPLGLISNKKGPTLREEVAHLGWSDYFQVMIGSGDATEDKPHPAPYHLARQQLSLPENPALWFIGDTDVDIALANATGMVPLLYGELAQETGGLLNGHAYQAGFQSHRNLQETLLSVLG